MPGDGYARPLRMLVLAVVICTMVSNCSTKSRTVSEAELKARYLAKVPLDAVLEERLVSFSLIGGSSDSLQTAVVHRTWSGSQTSRKGYTHIVLFNAGNAVGRWGVDGEVDLKNSQISGGVLSLALSDGTRVDIDLNSKDVPASARSQMSSFVPY